jgi:hypothetical protein
LVFSVLYPDLSDSIISDYVASISNQTDPYFDWLIVNDNAGCDKLHLFPEKVTWIHLASPLSFGQIREIGISCAIERGYDCIIFSDMDDYYSDNRVELSRLYLEENEFAFTELQIVNMEKKLLHSNYLSKLKINQSLSSIRDILDRNYCGLSHSAVRTSALLNFEIPAAIEVVDWWLFSILLIHKHAGRFIPEADTFYRQNDENFVGVCKLLDLHRLSRGINVKLTHYGNLLEFCRRQQMPEMVEVFHGKYQEVELLRDMTRNISFAKQYINTVNSNFDKLYKGWWSEIISIDEWGQL